MFALRRQSSGTEFLPHEQQRIVAISCVLRSRDGLKVWSLGDVNSTEAELVERFFDGIERFSPDLISWNGSGFDLPVLTLRALAAGVQAPRYWETGDSDTAFRYNNYLSRFHWRHTDLMDVLSAYQSRGRVSLQNAAMLLGLPGKLGFSGDKVWDAWLAGNLVGIRQYCETDVLNTYLVYLRFEMMRGRFTRERYAEEVERVKALLRAGTARSRISPNSCAPGKPRLEREEADLRGRRGGDGRRAHSRGRGRRSRRQDGFRPRRASRRKHQVPPDPLTPPTRRGRARRSPDTLRQPGGAPVPALRRLRRLRPPTSGTRSATRSAPNRASGKPRAPRQSNTPDLAATAARTRCGATAAAPGSARSSSRRRGRWSSVSASASRPSSPMSNIAMF